MEPSSQGIETAALVRADMFLKKKNYEVALRALKESGLAAIRDDVAEQIAFCQRQLDGARARDLVKRARKHLQKGRPDKALECFEQARDLAPDPALDAAIAELQAKEQTGNAQRSARAAARAGQFARAAELYGEAHAACGDEALRLEQARCLVRAEQYEAAVQAFSGAAVTARGALYDFGFARLHSGRPGEAVAVWRQLDSEAPEFVAQLRQARDLAAEELLRRFAAGADRAVLYAEAHALLSAPYDGPTAAAIAALAACCEAQILERWWQQARYRDILDLLLARSARPTDVERLALAAKCAYRLAQGSAAMVEDFVGLWFTALAHDDVAAQLAHETSDVEPIVSLLLRWGEELVVEHCGRSPDDVERARQRYGEQWRRLQEVKRAVGSDGVNGVLATPRYARMRGACDEILARIRQHRSAFVDDERYFDLGAAYSAAGESLQLCEDGDTTKAVAALPAAPGEDPLVLYAVRKVWFCHALHRLKAGGRVPAAQLRETHLLFEVAPGLANRMLKDVSEVCDPGAVRQCEDVLAELLRRRPESQPLRRALSQVMTRRAVAESRTNEALARAATKALQQALELDPDNEAARVGLDDNARQLELAELDRHLRRGKVNRACTLAASSSYSAVRQHFLDYIAEDLRFLLAEPPGEATGKLAQLSSLEHWCTRIDATHHLLGEIINARARFEKEGPR